MRITGGLFRSRTLVAPKGQQTRPTSDRVREALFSSLATLVDLEGCRFADLYAGSGAVGIEALSRGAAHALFVESSPKATRVLWENLAALGVAHAAEVVTAPVASALARGPGEPYDVVFADPPYRLGTTALQQVLGDLAANGWLADDAVVVVERGKREPWDWPDGFAALRDRTYGDTRLWYGHRVPA